MKTMTVGGGGGDSTVDSFRHFFEVGASAESRIVNFGLEPFRPTGLFQAFALNHEKTR